MCGIAGIFVLKDASSQAVYSSATRKMTELMARRGPDDQQFWHDPAGKLHLGFRRLSVLDLTPAGAQPMVSSDERSVLVFNGEIYNFPVLRRELEGKGVAFRSRCDAEVLLEALNFWGVDALSRLNGMFAFAWYDRANCQLLLARDHAGIKPLYYFLPYGKKGLAFASQYNALLHTPWGEPGAVRSDVLRLYLRLHHIPPPYGLLENTFQLEPGHYLLLNSDGDMQKRPWWRLPRDPEPDLRGNEAEDALASTLEIAVRRQRVADVPLGVFLSGGVDSPLVTAVAREQTNSHLKAFIIGNPGWSQDEATAAACYGDYLDVDYRIHNMSGTDALEIFDDVMAAQHEPFADFSILPTLIVSRFARREVTVTLSGDGGDELFFGYERPRSLMRNGADFRWPWPLRLGLYGAGKFGFGPRRSDTIVHRTPGHYYYEVNTRFKLRDLARIAPGLTHHPHDFDLYHFHDYQNPRHLLNFSRYVEFYGQLQRCLKKVDMASMHYSLEVRVPLLDREVIETSLRIDPFANLDGDRRKAVLRDVLAHYVPPSMIPAPKRGFAVPLGEWLRGPLRPLVERTLLDLPLYPDGVFDRAAVQAYWQTHLLGHKDHKWGIWSLLALQWWAQQHVHVGTSAFV